MGEKAPSARNLAQLYAAILVFELSAQIHKRALHFARLHFEHIGKRDGAHRLVGYEEHRLERAPQLVILQP